MLPGNEAAPDDEIDLRTVASHLSRAIAYPFRLLLRSWMVAACFAAVAVALAITVKVVIPRSYRSSFIIRPNDPKEKLHLRIFGDVQVLLKEGNRQELSKMLSLDTLTIKKVSAIRLHNPFVKNPLDSLNATEITIIAADPSVFEPVQNAMLRYLESTPYFAMLRDLQARQVAFEMKETDADIRRLDSLKALQLARYGWEKPGEASALSMLLLNPAAAYTVSTEKINKRSNLMAREVFLSSFQLVKPVVRVKHHYWPPRVLVLCLWMVPVSLIICALFLHFRKGPPIKRTRVPS